MTIYQNETYCATVSKTYISGGLPAKLTEFPHMVSQTESMSFVLSYEKNLSRINFKLT